MCEDNNLKQPLVSIITPTFNSEKYIKETVESVLRQTYQNWELLIVDDISTDNTVKIAKEYADKDSRIKIYILDSKGGASIARNKGIRESKGKFVAFLDSDDIWKKDKLKKQVQFMIANNIAFSYHNYELIDSNSKKIKKLKRCPKHISYISQLFGCSIGCLSVMYDQEKIGLVQIKRIDKRNDDALWLFILKKCKKGYLLDENLAYYRTGNSSLSSGNKTKLLKYHYYLYRDNMNKNVISSIFFTCTNILVYFINKLRFVNIEEFDE